MIEHTSPNRSMSCRQNYVCCMLSSR